MESSSVSKNVIENGAAEEASEESGWTAYLEDFSCSDGSFAGGTSVVSDAACGGSDSIRRLNFNKLKKNNQRKCSYDDDLEDTASSPVNSPKVSTAKQMEVNYGRIDDVASNNFLGKQAVSSNLWKQDQEERNEKNVIDSKNNIEQYVELRERGLCLVPMSTLINFLG